jgi:hypothetical protein
VSFACGRVVPWDLARFYWPQKVLTIEHRDYMVNAGQSKEARVIVPEAAIALTSSHDALPPAPGNTALAQLPFSGQSTARRLRAARLRAIPFSMTIARDCH